MIITLNDLKENMKHQNNFKPKEKYSDEIILFLDFDGVMHPLGSTGQDFSNNHRLEKLVEKFPTLFIVVSSSWGMSYKLDELKQLFTKKVANRIIGKTSDVFEKRSDAIKKWLNDSCTPFSNWVAIDDCAFFDDDSPVVWCDPRIGWDDAVNEALETALSSPIEYRQYCADRDRIKYW